MDMTPSGNSLDSERLPHQLQAIRRRVQLLYQKGSATLEYNDLLAESFDELATAMEELRAADEERRREHKHWLDERTALETDILRYRDLFDQAPIGYVVTSFEGAIRRANSTAAALLQTEVRLMIGRSLALFIPEGQRRTFRVELDQLRGLEHPRTWKAEIQPWQGTPIPAEFTVAVPHGRNAFRWLIQDIRQRQQTEQQLRARIAELEQQLQLYEQAPAERVVGADGV